VTLLPKAVFLLTGMKFESGNSDFCSQLKGN
jgi:hypothetical protein